MDQGNALFSDLDQILGIPSSIGKTSSSTVPNPWLGYPTGNFWDLSQPEEVSPFSFAPESKPIVMEQDVNDLYASPQTLKREDLELSTSLNAQNQMNNLSQSSTVSPSVQARFTPPKGPRKQHRTGFRQLPGPTGKIKRGRPSKKEYKLGGVEIDMYSVKGVTLHGPVRSLEEVEGAEPIKRVKEKRKTAKSNGSKPISQVKALVKSSRDSDPISRPTVTKMLSDTSTQSHLNDLFSPFNLGELPLQGNTDSFLKDLANYSAPNPSSGGGCQVPDWPSLHSQPTYSTDDNGGFPQLLNVPLIESSGSQASSLFAGEFHNYSFPDLAPPPTSSPVYNGDHLQELHKFESVQPTTDYSQIDNGVLQELFRSEGFGAPQIGPQFYHYDSEQIPNFTSLNPSSTHSLPHSQNNTHGSINYSALGLEWDGSASQSLNDSIFGVETNIPPLSFPYAPPNPSFYQPH